MREYKIAAIPGDGIGPEVIAAGIEVLNVLAERDGGFRLTVTNYDWGSDYYKKNGVMMPPGGPRAAASVRRDLLRRRRRAPTCRITSRCGACASRSASRSTSTPNVRPTRILPGISSPLRSVTTGKELDWVIVRENSEGEIRRPRRDVRIAVIRRKSAPKS
jgi:tartrate dehydrogenase/decarboxylase/D-malate dehydrogenase